MALMISGHIIEVTPSRPEPEIVSQAATVIETGGIVVAPTETRYGLLARADCSQTVERVFDLKGRSGDRAVAVFLRDITEAGRVAHLDRCAHDLAERFLPGPLTLILRRRPECRLAVGRGATIGIRISSSPVIQAILTETNVPLTATSANISGGQEPDTITELVQCFGERVNLYLDGGPLTGPPSTVVDCTRCAPTVLRQGAIAERLIRNAVGGRVK
ncbi:MAG: L-threonylcarbamoyladenylate synthase [Candidatus Zixiibacteriota bacterium]